MAEASLEHVRVCTRFGFAADGIAGGTEFTGPVVLFRDGLFLVARRATTPSDRVAIAVLGLLAIVLALWANSIHKVQFPYPAVSAGDLPEGIRSARGFGRLRPKDRIVVVRRDQVVGYQASLLRGFTLFCSGESIKLIGSLTRLKKAFAGYGFVECGRRPAA